MKNLLILFLSLTCFTSTLGQAGTEQLESQLSEMRDYFLAEDYENFANFTHPKILEMAGGKANMVAMTKQAIDGLKSQNVSFTKLEYSDISEILEKDGELQCTIVQDMILDTPNGKIQSTSALIGISQDGGQNWSFIETSGKDKATLAGIFPNLHDDLVIPPSSQKMVD